MKLIDLLVKELPKRGGWPGMATHAWSDSDGEIRFRNGGCKPDFYPAERVDSEDRIPSIMHEDDPRYIVTLLQYEAALAKNDGWIEWGGGECPVEEGALVDIRDGDGCEWHGVKAAPKDEYSDAASTFWEHKGSPRNNIIAYRLHKPDINSRASDDRLEQDLNECIGQDVDMPEWSEGGLPPVGIKCEFTNGPYSVEAGELTGIIPKVGGVVEVVAHRLTSDNNPVAVVYWDDNGAGWFACFVKECFRPLRTEAEKELEAAIQDLTSVICGNVPDTGMATAAMYAKRVYDAGYRKESK